MKSAISLELIGDDANPSRPFIRPWIARITGFDDRYGLARQFLSYQTKDYSRANSVGSRGIYAHYILAPGLYEVSDRVSWKRTHRYFLQVSEDGSKSQISEDEVKRCLQNTNSASTS